MALVALDSTSAGVSRLPDDAKDDRVALVTDGVRHALFIGGDSSGDTPGGSAQRRRRHKSVEGRDGARDLDGVFA